MKDWEASYLAGIIDGEGSITLTRIHENEHRRPCITIASTDKELLIYLQSLTRGAITNKKNYNPARHKDSYVLSIKNKKDVFSILEQIIPFLRVNQKKKRAKWIIEKYDLVTARNGKYNQQMLLNKNTFEEGFFQI
ncbi:hypothetical protein GCM10008967_17130 [Bacillus carboniphilus]|uniref:Homing endonuclease LAGLIDADG domain-containing protein n=1 Tax=Bacillus carboniphilus TaxID=86663 RepID=A0ABN0W6V2_9BACI